MGFALFLNSLAADTINPVADAHVNSGLTNSNFGSETNLEVKSHTSDPTRYAYLKFNLSGVGDVSNATLRLNGHLFNTAGNASVPLEVRQVSDTNWGESTIKWPNKPSLGTKIVEKGITTNLWTWYDFDVTSYIRSERSAGKTLISLGLQQSNYYTKVIYFQSKEAASSYRPQLVIVTNRPPAIAITSPASGAYVPAPTNVTLSASASDPDGSVAQVNFYTNGTLLATLSTAPYNYSWNSVAAGVYTVTAVATDNLGLSAASAAVVLHVVPIDQDSDYDGRTDLQEANQDGTSPTNSSSVKRMRLGHWRFDTSAFVGDEGQVPLHLNVTNVAGWNGNVARQSSAPYTGLRYRDVETNGNANFNCRNGTVRFWYRPSWTSAALGGTGPQTWARIIELGGWSSDAMYGWWELGLDPSGNEISFGSHSNGIGHTYIPPGGLNHLYFNWQAGRWYQITLTYSPTNSVLYINGEVIGTGYGIQNYPDATKRAIGFNLGMDVGGGQQLQGDYDEMETFNYPLDPKTVYAEFPNAQTSSLIPDSDYDGRSDFLETYVDATNPNDPASVLPVRLGLWRFNTTNWLSERGFPSWWSNGVTSVATWSSNGASIPNQTAWSGLLYYESETNGWVNFNCRNGTVRFWFKPNWSTGGGPQTWARLFEMGGYGYSGGWWEIGLDLDGSHLGFLSMTNGTQYVSHANTSINWTSNYWHQIAVTYSPTSTATYIDGVLVGSDSGIQVFPNAPTRTNGFRLGFDWYGGQSAGGVMEDLETFNYPMSAAQIAADFSSVQAVDRDLNGIADVLEDTVLPASAPFTTVPWVVTGTMEAEQFDRGGPGVSYSSTVTNAATAYRPTALYIDASDDRGAGYCVSRLRAGDWMNYTFEVRRAGYYTLEARVARVGTNATGGAWKAEFGRANSVNGWQTPGQPLQQALWHDAEVHNIYLEAGTNTLKLIMTTNASDGYVGRFNYLTIRPSIPAYIPPSNPLTINVTASPYLAVGNNNPAFATSNRVAIQSALTALAANGGGRLYVPGGTYYVNKDPVLSPTEDSTAWVHKNAALNLTNINYSNIEIVGDAGGVSVLKAYDRSTTVLFHLGCTNLALRDIVIQGRPHIRPDGTYDDAALISACANVGSCYSYGMQSLLVYLSCTNVTVTHSKIMNASAYNVIIGLVENMLFATNALVYWEGEALPSPLALVGQVGIFGSASPSANIMVVSNYFNGNPANETNSSLYSSDGIVWFQAGGNWFVGRNHVRNYGLEAVQFGDGPAAVVGNYFVTGQKNGSVGAMVSFAAYGGLTDAGYRDQTFYFVGNYVNGGRQAYFGGYFATSYGDRLYNVHLCGNDVTLSPPVTNCASYDWPSSVAYMANCARANIAGNTLRTGREWVCG